MSWLEICVIVLLAVMAWVGYKKGFVKMVVGLLAMVLALVGTTVIAPWAGDFINNNTNLRQKASDAVVECLEEEIGQKLEQTTAEAQKQAIEKLSLPDSIKEAIEKNNTSEMYEKLGVSSFAEYVGNYVAGAVISAIAYLVTFLVLYVALRCAFTALNLVALLPFLKSVNKLAGAAMGLLQAVVYVWVFFALATAAMNSQWGMDVLKLVAGSKFLSWLYHYNVVLAVILKSI